MSDINRVAKLGYTLLIDSQKAAHFCSCTGCNHGSNHVPSDQIIEEEPAICITAMGSSTEQEAGSSNIKKSCCSSTGETSEVKICQCNHDKTPSGKIALINTIDKTALFRPIKLINFTSESLSKFIFPPSNTISFSKEIFRPPQ